MSSDSNAETLRSYQARTHEYVEGTHNVVDGAAKDWIDRALSRLSAQAKILEVGSAFGRDAAYIKAQGFALECTDAVHAFVERLQSAGFNARQLNLLTDALPGPYDLILANAVLLHFNRSEFAFALKNVFRALAPGGRLAISLKRGQGEGWSNHKLDAPRFFFYWEQETLEPLLKDCGFREWAIAEAITDRLHTEWLFVIARK